MSNKFTSKMLNPKTLEEYLNILNAITEELDKLSGMLPGMYMELPNLEGLSFDENLKMGEDICKDLRELTYNISPSTVLDRLEEKLINDVNSKKESILLLKKLSEKNNGL
ncbi:hypothetical protein GW835_04330 [archaeon]|nr:hypothetical protein [archaeon]NCP98557.1 hypothetical protein [archaeon]NCQ52405.1 hypothetical protein [archaeon]